MLMSAAICGLNGAGSALGSPNGFCAVARPGQAARAIKAASAITTTVRLRMYVLPRCGYATIDFSVPHAHASIGDFVAVVIRIRAVMAGHDEYRLTYYADAKRGAAHGIR